MYKYMYVNTRIHTYKYKYTYIYIYMYVYIGDVIPRLKPGDIYVLNYGLHLHPAYGCEYSKLASLIPTLKKLKSEGVHVVW
jgi:hypothetical protein